MCQPGYDYVDMFRRPANVWEWTQEQKTEKEIVSDKNSKKRNK